MTRWIASLALLLHTWTCAAAPPSDASIRELMAVTRAEAMVAAIQAQFDPMLRQMATPSADKAAQTPEEQAAQERRFERMRELLRTEVSWARLEPLQIEVYRESLDQEEIDALIAFYRTPTGQIMVNKMPAIAQKSMVVMQRYMQESAPRLQAEIKKILEEERRAPR